MTRKKLPLSGILLCAFLFFGTMAVNAQSNNGINYQAIARDANGNTLDNQMLVVRFAIKSSSLTGPVVYEEEHGTTSIVQTNDFGLLNLIIGAGTQVGGSAASFDAIDWKSGPHYLRLSIDDGTGMTAIDSTRLNFVPYAMYALSSGDSLRAGTGIRISNDSIINEGDLSSTNELISQFELISNNRLVISEGGNSDTVDLSTLANVVDNISLDSAIGNRRFISILGGNQINFSVADPDSSTTNEIQSLTLNSLGDSLILSQGGAVAIADFGLVDDQQLSLNGTNLDLTGLNPSSVDLSSLLGVDTVFKLNDTALVVQNFSGTRDTLVFNGILSDTSNTNELLDSAKVNGNVLELYQNGSQITADVSSLVNTDEQDLSLIGDSIAISGGAGIRLTSILGVDSVRAFNDTTLNIYNADGTVDQVFLKGNGIDTSNTNELVDTMYFSNSALYYSQQGVLDSVVLDSVAKGQRLILRNQIIKNRNNIDSLRKYQSIDSSLTVQNRDSIDVLANLITNGDRQNLSLNGDTLFIDRGDSVNLNVFRDTAAINALTQRVNADSLRRFLADNNLQDGLDTLNKYFAIDSSLTIQNRDSIDVLANLITNGDRQNLSLNGDTLFIDRGDSVNLNVFRDTAAINALTQRVNADSLRRFLADNNLQDGLDTLNKYFSIDSSLTVQNRDSIDVLANLINNGDRQNLSLNGDTLFIDRGDSVNLNVFRDTAAINALTQRVNADSLRRFLADNNLQDGLDTLNKYFAIDSSLTVQNRDSIDALVNLINNGDKQNLKLNGDTLFIDRGDSVNLNVYRDTAAINALTQRVNADSLIRYKSDSSLQAGLDTLNKYFSIDTAITFKNQDSIRVLVNLLNQSTAADLDGDFTNELIDSARLVNNVLEIYENGNLTGSVDLDSLGDAKRLALTNMINANANNLASEQAFTANRFSNDSLRIALDSALTVQNRDSIDAVIALLNASSAADLDGDSTNELITSMTIVNDSLVIFENGTETGRVALDSIGDYERSLLQAQITNNANNFTAEQLLTAARFLNTDTLTQNNADSIDALASLISQANTLDEDRDSTNELITSMTIVNDSLVIFENGAETGRVALDSIGDYERSLLQQNIANNAASIALNATGIIDSTNNVRAALVDTAQAIRNDIGGLNSNFNLRITQDSLRLTADSTTFRDDIDANAAAIVTEASTRAADDATEAAARIAGDNANATGIIDSTNNVRAALVDTAQAIRGSISGLNSNFNSRIIQDSLRLTADSTTFRDDIDANAAAIVTEASTRAADDATEAAARIAGDNANAANIALNATGIIDSTNNVRAALVDTAQAIRGSISGLNSNFNSRIIQDSLRLTADSTTFRDDIDANAAAIVTEASTRAADDATEAAARIAGDNANSTGIIDSTNNVRAALVDTAQAIRGSISGLNSNFNSRIIQDSLRLTADSTTFRDDIDANAAAIVTEASTRAADDATETAARIAGDNANATGIIDSTNNVRAALVDTAQAIRGSISGLNSNFNSRIIQDSLRLTADSTTFRDDIDANAAAIVTEASTRAADDATEAAARIAGDNANATGIIDSTNNVRGALVDTAQAIRNDISGLNSNFNSRIIQDSLRLTADSTTFRDDIDANAAAIVTEASTRAADDATEAAARIAGDNANSTGIIDSTNNVRAALVDTAQAIRGSISGLNSNFNSRIIQDSLRLTADSTTFRDDIDANAAAIVTEASTRAADDATEAAARIAGDNANATGIIDSTNNVRGALVDTAQAIRNDISGLNSNFNSRIIQDSLRLTADSTTFRDDIDANAAAIVTEASTRAADDATETAARIAGDNANAASIATNATNIGTNATAISTNASAISDNADSITVHRTDINNLSNASVDITDSLTAHRTDINTNTGDIASNAAAITAEATTRAADDATETAARIAGDNANAASIATNTTNIGANTSAISTNTSGISDNADSITVHRTDINNLSNASVDITDSLIAHRTDINANTGDIATNAAAIAADTDGDATNELNTGFQVNGGNLEITDAGGTIQVPLTSLNTSSDNQNLSVTADSIKIEDGTGAYIGDIRDTLTDHNTRILTNRSDIATNAASITTNTSNIGTNTSAISTNASGISDNADSITVHRTDINNLSNASVDITDSLTAHRTDINTNTGGIAINASNIVTNTTNIGTNTTAISTNASGISDNADSITVHRTDINNLSNASVDITDSLTAHRTDINANTGDIATNAAAIVTEASTRAADDATETAARIAGDNANAASIATNATNIGTNTTAISTNASAISDNADSITVHRTDINNLSNASVDITDSLIAHRTDINANTGDIATNAAAIAADTDGDATNELNTGFQVNGGNLEITDAGGTIQVPLTSLNTSSDNQNLSVTADSIKIEDGTGAYIGDIRDTLTDHNTRILTNRSDIATNAASITTNTSNIGTNTSAISTNASGISDNADSITVHRTDINNLSNTSVDITDSLTAHRTDINANTGDIATNAAAIAADADGDATNELNTGFQVNGGNLEITDAGGTIQVPLTSLNTSSDNQNLSVTADSIKIEDGTGAYIGDIRDTLTDHNTRILTNRSDIATNAASITTNTSNIGTNTSAISTNASGISDNADSITVHRTDINNLSNTSVDITDSLTAHRTDINANAANIVNNVSGISDNLDSITVHRTDINTNAAAIAADLDGDATNELQSLSINTAGDSILISNGTGVDVSRIRDTSLTDLADTAAVLRTAISNAGDDLGDHTATTNISLGSNYLSSDGDNEGISIDNGGNVGIGIAASSAARLNLSNDAGIPLLISNSETSVSTTYAANISTTGAGNGNNIGIQTSVTGATMYNAGYSADATGSSNGQSFGIDATSTETANGTAFGGRLQATSNDGISYGLFTRGTSVNGTSTGYGLYTEGIGAGTVNYGLYSKATGASTNWAAYFDDGDVFVKDTLRFNNTFTLTNGAGANKVLTSDANGVATWQNAQGDNLGNHTATMNLDLGTNALVGDGGTIGLVMNSAGRIGIGGGPAQANRRLYVSTTTDQYAGQFVNSVSGATNTSFGVDGISNGANPGGSNIGLKGEASGAGTNVAVQGIGPGPGNGNYSGYFLNGKFYIADSLGLGTANPTERLDVNGKATIDALNINSAYDLPTVSGSGDEVLKYNAGGTALEWGTVDGDNLGDHSATTNIQLNGNFISNDGNNEGLSISNAGIVTVTPATTGAGSTAIRAEGDYITNGQGTGYYLTNTQIGITGNNGNSGDMRFKTGSTDRAIITNTGLVGINEPSPSYRLDVGGTFSANSINVNDAYTFPNADGMTDYVLKTDGSGALSFVDVSTLTTTPTLSQVITAGKDAAFDSLKNVSTITLSDKLIDSDGPNNYLQFIGNNHVFLNGDDFMDLNVGKRLTLTSGDSLTFRTNGLTRLRINQNGNIGVGTFAPDSLLDVAGGVRVQGLNVNSAYSLPAVGGSNDEVLKYNAAGTALEWGTVDGDDLGNHTATTNIQLNGNYLSNDGDNEGIRLDNSGNVGIGVAANSNYILNVLGKVQMRPPNSEFVEIPGYGGGLKVHDGTDNQSVRLIGSTGGALYRSQIVLNTPSSNLVIYAPSQAFNVPGPDTTGVDASGSLLFTNNGSNTMMLTKGNNIGMGTLTPAYKLDVNGSFSANSINVNDVYTLPTNDGDAGTYLQTDGAGNVSWAEIDTAVCPTGMANINGRICIETNERAATDWFTAASTCTMEGYKLPTWAEWYGAANNAVLTDETNNWEWVDGGTSNTARKVGNGGLQNTANDDPATGSNAYRCVLYLK